MKTIFTPQYQANLLAAWEKFIKNEPYDYSFIRPEIFESWKRSRDAGVSPDNVQTHFLSGEELNIRINSNIELIEIVHPYMEKLYSIVKDSGFYLLFCDKDGYILDLLGDPDIIQFGKKESALVVGANRQESIAGTNAIGTCLHTKKPIQIWGGEHYLPPHKGYTCCGAPLLDQNGNIVGCLNLTGLSENVHPHTLGLVISAVDGITKEMNIRKAYADIELISAQRNSILQSINSGVFLLNQTGRIIQTNNRALEMLDLQYESIIGKTIFDFISFNEKKNRSQDFAVLESETYNKEMNVYLTALNSIPKRFNISIHFVKDTSGKSSGTVLLLSDTHVINQLVNEVSGSTPKYTFESIIGNSSAITSLVSECRQHADTNLPLLLEGQPGTGKELFARSIHSAGKFSSGPFVTLSCTSIPKSFIQNELFGSEDSAYNNSAPGKLELSDGGTLFIDDIDEMPLDLQAALLRVIQTKETIRTGGKYPKSVNVRIIAATSKNLALKARDKSFREDLFARLDTGRISFPSLSDRKEDIRALTIHFIKHYSSINHLKITEDACIALENYSWPGNIRQLENVVERAVHICTEDVIDTCHLPEYITMEDNYYGNTTEYIRPKSSDNDSEDTIKLALQHTKGNVSSAAKLLGISRRTLYRKLEKFEIDSDEFR